MLTPGDSLFLDSVDEGILVFVQSHVTDSLYLVFLHIPIQDDLLVSRTHVLNWNYSSTNWNQVVVNFEC